MSRDELVSTIQPELNRIVEMLRKEIPDAAIKITKSGAQVVDKIEMPYIYRDK